MKLATRLAATDITMFDVQEECLEVALADAIHILNATRRTPADHSRFRWLYLDNPDGIAKLWSVREVKSGAIAGIAAALPRRVIVDGVTLICWNCADLSVLPEYRRRGLASRLRIATATVVDSTRTSFLYGHPNSHSSGAHRKAGYAYVGSMVRYAMMLRTAPYLHRYLRSHRTANTVGSLIDPLLHLRRFRRRYTTECDVHWIDPIHFDGQFDELTSSVASHFRIIGIRDSQYLNWRYAINPLYYCHLAVATVKQTVVGYATFTVRGDVCHIEDVFPPTDTAVVYALLREVIAKANELGLTSVSITMLEGNPLLPLVEMVGLRRRPDTTEMFVYTTASSSIRDVLIKPSSWFLTVGDRDC